jgi:hypothetical protein
LVEKVPAVPAAVVFQKESTPQVPVGVAPAPAVLPLLSQYKETAGAIGVSAAKAVIARRSCFAGRAVFELFMFFEVLRSLLRSYYFKR